MRTLIAALVSGVALCTGAISAQPRSLVELERTGWEAIHAAQLPQAADAFREALRLAPRNARLMLGAGLAAYLLGRTEEARQHLTGALQAQPALKEASILLGQLLHRSGSLDAAVLVYEQALAHAPGDPVLTAKLDVWRAEAELHGRFSQRLGNYFTVFFEGPQEEALAVRALELLEAAYWRIGTALGTYPRDVITVVLYTNEQFRDITRSPAWAAAAYDGRIRVPMRGALRNPRELERLLSHELTHALVHNLAPRGVPQWLNEGLAVTFEPGARADARDALTIRLQTTGAAGRAAPIPLSRLERSFDGLSKEEAGLAYTQSVVAVQVLIEQIGMAGVLTLLSSIGDGLPFEVAFARVASLSYEEFQRSWYESHR